MVGEFSVRVDFSVRTIEVACVQCGDATSVDLSEPGFARVLAVFASNHRHLGPAPALSLVPRSESGHSGTTGSGS